MMGALPVVLPASMSARCAESSAQPQSTYSSAQHYCSAPCSMPASPMHSSSIPMCACQAPVKRQSAAVCQRHGAGGSARKRGGGGAGGDGGGWRRPVQRHRRPAQPRSALLHVRWAGAPPAAPGAQPSCHPLGDEHPAWLMAPLPDPGSSACAGMVGYQQLKKVANGARDAAPGTCHLLH